jgi:hypothetical protein
MTTIIDINTLNNKYGDQKDEPKVVQVNQIEKDLETPIKNGKLFFKNRTSRKF